MPGTRLFIAMVVASALSLSVGWGIRGNFGHAYGAMIPGALAALAAVVISGRKDWWRRAAYFGMFGAIGWAFGGTISYMHVISYTHSGHEESQLYGFACLCVIGFIWGVLGGAGTAFPACLDRERLTSLFTPTLVIIVAWHVQSLFMPYRHWVFPGLGPIPASKFRHEDPFYLFDSSWQEAVVALLAVLILAMVQLVLSRRLTFGTRLALCLATGWLLCFFAMVLLVNATGIQFRMTPPRGDNWAGVLGMTIAAFIFLLRNRLMPVAHAALVTGIFGGLGFAGATYLKLVEVKYVPIVLSHYFGESTWQTNWHSVLEQSYGFINGIGIGVAMYILARRVPQVEDEPRSGRWTEVIAVGFVLLLLTYVNIIKNVPRWVGEKALPIKLYNVPTWVWFDVAYALLAIAILVLLAWHVWSRVAIVPRSPLGKAQLLYIVLLWWIVIGNVMRAIPPFPEGRLITEGVIHVNAILCTLLILLVPRRLPLPDLEERPIAGLSLLTTSVIGLLALVTLTGAAYVSTRQMHGDKHVPQSGKNFRFGPNAPDPYPVQGKEHP